MTFQKKFFVNKMRCCQYAFLVLALAGVVTQSEATIYTLTHGDSSVKINDAQGSGAAYDWTIGGVNQLNNQWFYYRNAPGQEFAIDSIDATPTSTLQLGRILTTTYANSSISVQVRFTLIDSANLGQSALNEVITVNNLSGAAMDLHFFQYSDYDLSGVSGGQGVQFYANGSGEYYKVVQNNGTVTLTETATSATPMIDHNVEAGFYNATLVKLTDGVQDNLNDVISAGPGDVTYAYQWHVSIAAGGSFQISKLQAIVPEPSSAALISLGVAAWGLVRRRVR